MKRLAVRKTIGQSGVTMKLMKLKFQDPSHGYMPVSVGGVGNSRGLQKWGGEGRQVVIRNNLKVFLVNT